MADDTRIPLFRELFGALLFRPPSPGEQARLLARHAGPDWTGTLAADLLKQPERRRRAAALGYPPGHFYSPVVDIPEAADYLDGLSVSEDEAFHGLQISRRDMQDLWTKLSPHFCQIPWPEKKASQTRYFFDNQSYPFTDAQIWSALLQHLKPARVIEIGSGFTSAVLLDTVDRMPGYELDLTFVQPFPHTIRSILWDQDWDRFKLIEKKVQDVDLALYDQLEAGDILFIDSTHVVKTGSDVTHEILQILPRLKPGVWVHFHDIFYPFEYPKPWICDFARSWNEIYVLRAYLLDNPSYRIRMFNNFMTTQALPPDTVRAERFTRNPGGGFWIERV